MGCGETYSIMNIFFDAQAEVFSAYHQLVRSYQVVEYMKPLISKLTDKKDLNSGTLQNSFMSEVFDFWSACKISTLILLFGGCGKL